MYRSKTVLLFISVSWCLEATTLNFLADAFVTELHIIYGMLMWLISWLFSFNRYGRWGFSSFFHSTPTFSLSVYIYTHFWSLNSPNIIILIFLLNQYLLIDPLVNCSYLFHSSVFIFLELIIVCWVFHIYCLSIIQPPKSLLVF